MKSRNRRQLLGWLARLGGLGALAGICGKALQPHPGPHGCFRRGTPCRTCSVRHTCPNPHSGSNRRNDAGSPAAGGRKK